MEGINTKGIEIEIEGEVVEVNRKKRLLPSLLMVLSTNTS